MSTNHVFRATEIEQARPGFVVALADGVNHTGEWNPIGPQAIRVDVHLILLSESSDRCNLRNSGHRLQVVLEIPILIRAQLRQAVLFRVIPQNVLKDPAQPGGVRTDLRFHTFGQSWHHCREIFEGSGARPIDVGALFEDHIHVGEAEVRDAAHRAHSRRSGHGGDDGIGDLIFENVRAAVPPREDDDLSLA